MQFDSDPAISSNDLLLGKSSSISGWRVGKKLHEGRWFNQYQAATIASDSGTFDYVFKSIKPGLSNRMLEQAITRMTSEAIVTEQVLQKNIIPLLDAELDHAPFFLVQPMIRGASLSQLIEIGQAIPLSRALWLVRQAAEAISAVHDYHRNYGGLHPSHILVGVDSEVSLIGWGNSLPFGQQQTWSPDQTALHPFWVAHYMAPEVFLPGYRACESSDVYSLGALIYRIFAGRPPFAVHDFEKLMKAATTKLHLDLQVVQQNCPGALNQLGNQMLTKDPTRRPNLKLLIDQLISLEIEFLQDETLIAL